MAAHNLAQPDPDVHIPAAVRAKAQQADEAFRAAHGENINGEAGRTEAQAQEENAAQTEATPEPLGEAQERVPQQGRQRRQREVTPPQEAPSEAQGEVTEPTREPARELERKTEPQAQPATAEEWERRARSAAGRVQKSEQQINALNEKINQLQNMLGTMQQAPPPAPAPESYITPEDRETYGDEFLSVVERKAKELVSPMQRELQAKIEELNNKLGYVGSSVAANQRDRMFGELDQKIPNWREVNTNPEFLEWLKLPDLYSGGIRHDLLRAAFESNNTSRVAAFFNGFLAEEAATVPQDQPHLESGAPVTRSQTPKVSLENLAAPGRAKTAPTQVAAEKPIFTRAQIAKFYADVNAGKFQGRDKQKDELEAKIFLAQQEGRIR